MISIYFFAVFVVAFLRATSNVVLHHSLHISLSLHLLLALVGCTMKLIGLVSRSYRCYKRQDWISKVFIEVWSQCYMWKTSAVFRWKSASLAMSCCGPLAAAAHVPWWVNLSVVPVSRSCVVWVAHNNNKLRNFFLKFLSLLSLFVRVFSSVSPATHKAPKNEFQVI